MKKYLLMLAAALAFAACVPKTPDDPEEPDQPEQPQKENPKPGVYKFVLADMGSKAGVDAAGKTSWEEGDEILVTGGYSPDNIIVTLKASDISADGKTATVNLDKVPATVFGPDDYYAAWPASAIESEDLFTEDCFFFTTTDVPLQCAWLSGDTFQFNHICAALSFSVEGDFDECVLAGKNWQSVHYDSWSVEVNSEYADYVYRKGNPSYFLRKKLGGGPVVMYFPNSLNLSDGFNIFMSKGKAYPKVYNHDSAAKVTHGHILALGDITGKLKDYDGPAPELPDMPVMGKYTKIEVKDVPELSGLCLTADGSALWTVGDNGWFGQVSFDGQVTKWWTRSADMEGITLHPETGDLYIACESHQVARVSAPDYTKESWKYVITVDEAKNYGNSGMEGISYYKDDLLFIGTQVGANVWLYSVNGEKRSEYVSLSKLNSAVKEVGGLCYDSVNHWLWVTDSEAHKLFVFDEELTHVLAEYPVPYIHNTESVCVDHAHNCVWVGLDDDNVCCIYRIEFTGLK